VAELVASGHAIEVHHRNEQRDGQEQASAGKLPCVLVSDASVEQSGPVPWEVLMDKASLQACGGDVTAFGSSLRAALDARG
jgi:hypothetical protein